MGPDQALELRRAAAPGDRQQHRFGRPRGHPGDGPHLGVAQDPVSERRIDARQPRQRPPDADALPGGAGSESAAVVQPVAEIAVAVFVPAAPPVHGGDELDEPPVGEVDMGRHVRDSRAQFGGIVGDEIQIRGSFKAGMGRLFGREFGVLVGFFGGLEHDLYRRVERQNRYCI